MRAFLGILLTLWLTALVSHPAAAEKRARQAVVQRTRRAGFTANGRPSAAARRTTREGLQRTGSPGVGTTMLID